jgi:hypothetical protein
MMARAKSYFEKCFNGIASVLEHEHDTIRWNNKKENTYAHKKVEKNYKGLFRKKI